MEFYLVNLFVFCAINVGLICCQRRRTLQAARRSASHATRDHDTTEHAGHLHVHFLVVYAFAVAADWLQGPHIYAIYKYEKHLPEELVALLLFLLLLGRVLGGISTTLLFSVFETWLIAEFHRPGADRSGITLDKIFGRMTLVSSTVAIVSGVAGDALVEATGTRIWPFAASSLSSMVAGFLILVLWRENYGNPPAAKGLIFRLHQGARKAFANKQIMALGLASCCLEGAMYLFVFFWSAALKSARERARPDEDVPYGLIFSSFMWSMASGSLILQTVFGALSVETAAVNVGISMLVASACFSGAAFFENESLIFWSFCVLESCFGAYFPAMAALKSQVVEDDIRGSVYSSLRLPLNLFVVVAHSLDCEGDNHRNRVFLLAQLVLHDAKLRLLQLASPVAVFFSHHSPRLPPRPRASPAADSLDIGPVCLNPAPFPTVPPASHPLTMALAAETKRVVEQFDFSDSDVDVHVKEFLRQMDEGLEKDGTSLSQIPTYVTGVPNGTEKGLYMAVDLGGTNFRVCAIQLNGDTTFNLTYSKVAIPAELMVAKTSSELFAFLAKQIELFLKEHHAERFASNVQRSSTPGGPRDENIFRLGFTFSFPVKQLAINKGLLMRWTKGFDIPDAVGKDVCALLQTEIDKLGLPVKVAALVNDTVGTLMARSYASTGKHRSIMGAIFGTGTNGAYIEKTANIKKPIEGEYDASTGEMVVNVEWGSFDNQLNVMPTTPWDKALDLETPNPGFQMFEKRISGMFLGELVRLAIVDMMKNEEISLFRDINSSFNDWMTTTSIPKESGLLKTGGLDSAILSVAAADNSPELSTLRQSLENTLHVYNPALEDAQAFKAVAGAVVRRAARMSAVALGAIALRSGLLEDPNEDVLDIGVDGSLVEHYPFFREMIYEALPAVEGIGAAGAKKIRIGIAKDGSGVGAALIALVAQQQEGK
ncbi:glucokinase [Purpureocillium lilacinum]|uniref:glucokinase n=1 Tax=Purpureocillium lilacinum TaxID=33203 RepID=A0A179H7L2_PURLI|nr:glucokinase [Purpureocillium lilacinum]